MPVVHPFRAWRYDTARVGPLEKLVTPPYDVISTAGRARMASASPFNLVHLALPQATGSLDGYAAAAASFRQWKAEGALRQDAGATLTRHRQTYDMPDGRGTRTRTGLLGLISLSEVPAGAVRPHERTLAGPRKDRQRLMQTVLAQLSPVFMLAPDPDGVLAALLEETPAEQRGDSYTDDDGHQHSVDVFCDANFAARAAELLADVPLLIADGHHRYESAMACHQSLTSAADVPGAVADEAGRVLVEVVSAASPGLTVLPTHRTVAGLPNFDLTALVARLGAQATVTPLLAAAPAQMAVSLLHRIKSDGPGTLGMLAGSPATAWVIRRRDDAQTSTDDPVERLDVAYLHSRILAEHLGIAEAAVEIGSHVGFVKDVETATQQLGDGQVQAIFFLNATPLTDLEAVTAAGRRMPQKSTYFFPKVPAGLVIHGFE